MEEKAQIASRKAEDVRKENEAKKQEYERLVAEAEKEYNRLLSEAKTIDKELTAKKEQRRTAATVSA